MSKLLRSDGEEKIRKTRLIFMGIFNKADARYFKHYYTVRGRSVIVEAVGRKRRGMFYIYMRSQ